MHILEGAAFMRHSDDLHDIRVSLLVWLLAPAVAATACGARDLPARQFDLQPQRCRRVRNVQVVGRSGALRDSVLQGQLRYIVLPYLQQRLRYLHCEHACTDGRTYCSFAHATGRHLRRRHDFVHCQDDGHRVWFGVHVGRRRRRDARPLPRLCGRLHQDTLPLRRCAHGTPQGLVWGRVARRQSHHRKDLDRLDRSERGLDE